MLAIGKLTPVFFNPLMDDFALSLDWVQRFYTTDSIHIQLATDDNTKITVKYKNIVTDVETSVTMQSVHIGSVYFMDGSVSGLADGFYTIKIKDSRETITHESEPFEVTSDASILDTTVLFECYNSDNDTFLDTLLRNKNVHYIFQFRVPGGFKPSGIQMGVDVETFRTQSQELRTFYAVSYTKYQLTIGDKSGCPMWVIEYINNMLCCDSVYIGPQRWVRSENATPETSQGMENGQLFFAMQLLEKLSTQRTSAKYDSFNNDFNADYD